MRRIRALLVALIFSWLASSWAGQAPTVPAKLQKRFSRMDLNRDGKVTLEEFRVSGRDRRNPDKQFRKWDRDGDGGISLEEFAAKKSRPGRGTKAGARSGRTQGA